MRAQGVSVHAFGSGMHARWEVNFGAETPLFQEQYFCLNFPQWRYARILGKSFQKFYGEIAMLKTDFKHLE